MDAINESTSKRALTSGNGRLFKQVPRSFRDITMRNTWCWVYQSVSAHAYGGHSEFMCVMHRIVQNHVYVWSGVFIRGVNVCEFR